MITLEWCELNGVNLFFETKIRSLGAKAWLGVSKVAFEIP
jgi:hypothetical protein